MIHGIHLAFMEELRVVGDVHQAELEATRLQLNLLTSETNRLLQKYEGKRVVSKDSKRLSGVVQKIDENKSPPQLVIMWRHNAICTNVSMADLFSKFEIEF
ncbi:unnamed protein product [Symbiodinium microadriaticum]|nr:unnamed protein product [Symbiodinium microadriaticum]